MNRFKPCSLASWHEKPAAAAAGCCCRLRLESMSHLHANVVAFLEVIRILVLTRVATALPVFEDIPVQS